MNIVSRRTWLRGVGQSAAAGALTGALPAGLRAAQPAAVPARASICLATLYLPGTGLNFDADRFRDEQLPLLRSSYGDTVEQIELRVSDPPAEGAPPPRFLAATNVWISDIQGYLTKANAANQAIIAGMANVTNSAPLAQANQVAVELGDGRETGVAGTRCMSIFFPSRDEGTWDEKYYFETYVPKVFELLGSAAVRRIEAVKGSPGSNGKAPAFLGAIHIYIRDPAAYDEATKNEAFGALNAEAQTHTTLSNFVVESRVHAAG